MELSVTCVKETETKNEREWERTSQASQPGRMWRRPKCREWEDASCAVLTRKSLGILPWKPNWDVLSGMKSMANYKYRTQIKRLRQEAVFFLGWAEKAGSLNLCVLAKPWQKSCFQHPLRAFFLPINIYCSSPTTSMSSSGLLSLALLIMNLHCNLKYTGVNRYLCIVFNRLCIRAEQS